MDHGPAGLEPSGFVADKMINLSMVPPGKSASKMLVKVSVLLSSAREQLHEVMMTSQPAFLSNVNSSGNSITILLAGDSVC